MNACFIGGAQHGEQKDCPLQPGRSLTFTGALASPAVAMSETAELRSNQWFQTEEYELLGYTHTNGVGDVYRYRLKHAWVWESLLACD